MIIIMHCKIKIFFEKFHFTQLIFKYPKNGNKKLCRKYYFIKKKIDIFRLKKEFKFFYGHPICICICIYIRVYNIYSFYIYLYTLYYRHHNGK